MSVTKVTIKDVARSAGVSIATVSNVLNDTGRVSADTVRTVRRAILELQFSPSQAARNLKDKKSRLIAVVVPLLHSGLLHDNPFYYLGTKHLIGLGRRDIALLTGEIEPNGVHEARFLGYRRALKEAGIGYRPALVVEEPPTMEGGARSVSRILGLHGVTAAFATSDVAAMGLLGGLSERGLSVPRDLSVAGFDDLPYSRFATPPLTTVAQDNGLKGREAVRLLQAHMDNREPPYRKKLIPVELKVRQSTRIWAEGEEMVRQSKRIEIRKGGDGLRK